MYVRKMRAPLTLCVLLVALSSFTFATTTVVITSPAENLTTPNQVGIVAYTYGPEQVRVLQIYLDNVKADEVIWPAHNRINKLVTATSAGNHRLTVQALDPNNAVVGLKTIFFNTTDT